MFWVEVVFGLKINMGKFELVLVGVFPNIADFVDVLGCKQGSFLMKYLGLPLGANIRDSSIWNPIIEKMERRVGWKWLYLSKGSKVTLIKSTWSNLPTYFLSLFLIPVEVAHRIEQLKRNFLWSGMRDDKKTHTVKWATVCAPLHSGGLAFRSLRSFNKVLFGKWL